ILTEASLTSGLNRIVKQKHEEYERVMTGFLADGRKTKIVGDNLDIRPLANALIALWNGLETLLVSGLPIDDARRAWLEALKAIFMMKQRGLRRPSVHSS